MLFHIIARDKANALELRLRTRPAHLDHAHGLGAQMKLGGPLLSADGETMIGSVMIIEAADRTELDAILAADPYVKAGLFAEIEIKPFRWLINAPP